ncbi:membrane protein [Bifidobacterium gallicum]|nr:membrane protein [Bifidobacterium gallicum]KFI58676.1 membrane protein [Bifidobacterium gallicum DSM 20093 = LMG 11596]
MANRAERRAKAKGKGIPQQYDSTNGRGRKGMIDEQQLQERSVRIAEGKKGPWKPTSSEIEAEEHAMDTDPNDFDPPAVRAPHSARNWARLVSWVVIVVSAMFFFVVMWLPNHPDWAILVVSGVFALGVLSLFFTAGNPKNNPNLDQNGTAV